MNPPDSHPVVTLRPAGEDDRHLLWLIQCQSLRPAIEATWGWDEALQRRHFEDHWGVCGREIIRIDGADAGMLSVEIRPDHVFLRNIALLPQFQARGIGTKVVRDVMDHASRLGLPVRLQVLKVNRARRLYERLGFREVAETPTHYQMVFDRKPG